MSETIDNESGIRRLPIFPLPIVLLPNELLPLHIFEDKYRKMIKDVAEGDNLFGLNWFEPVESFIERPEIGSIGCIAEINDVQPLPDGRSNIVVTGNARYRLVDYFDGNEPYLVADLEMIQDDDADPAAIEQVAEEVFGIFERVARSAFKLTNEL